MRISDLESYGLPSRVLEVWRERHGEILLPVQQKAVRKGLLDSPDNPKGRRNLVIAAPTSSGKSFCGEMAALKAVANRRRVVWLTPLRSLAEELYRLFEKSYGSLGIDCLIASSDHPENDRAFLEGDYHVAVAIYEKFDQLLTSRLDSLRDQAVIVIDELQMVADPCRGVVLERMLTKILGSVYRPYLLGLSAVIGDEGARQLAGWLDADIVEETSRPVELIRGVAAAGSWRFREYNSGNEGSLPFPEVRCGEDPVMAFIDLLKAEPGSVLVFMKSRRDTVNLAFRLAAAVSWPSAQSALDELASEEPSYLTRSLQQALSHSVAFHNADLSNEQRLIVEKAFREKAVKVLFSTTTLSLGVNLPADTVFLETVKYVSGTYPGPASLEPISRSEFDNMTGRAGRLGSSEGHSGKAVLLADNEFERDVLWNQYIAERANQALKSHLRDAALQDWVLHLVVCGLAASRADLDRLIRVTLGFTTGSVDNDSLHRAVDRLLEAGLLNEDRSLSVLSTSFAGSAAAKSGLNCHEAVYFTRALQSDRPHAPFGWTALALSSPYWAPPASILSRREHRTNASVKALYRRFDYSVDEVCFLLPDNHRCRPLEYRTAAALKTLLVLDEWCRLTPLQQIEQQYQVHVGQIMGAGETVAHLILGLAALIEAEDMMDPAVGLLRQHAYSVRFGIPAEFEELCRDTNGLLRRSELAALSQLGLDASGDLSSVSSDQLTSIIKDKTRLDALLKISKHHTKEISMNAPYLTPCQMAGARPSSIEIDGSLQGDRYLVKIDGFPVYLTGKSFKYFTKLAWSRANRDGGWIYKEDIEVGFNQARYLYRMKNEMNTFLRSNWPIFENNRLGYYRLDLEPERISINFENLKLHSDYELRVLNAPARLAPAQMGAAAPC